MSKKTFRGIALVFFLFLAATTSVFALGRREEAVEPVPVNPEFVLLITELDVSGLPLARQLLGETVARNLAVSLNTINYRLRDEYEQIYYKFFAWENARAQAAQALRARRHERDQLIFRGEPGWRHRRNLRNVEEAIEAMERQVEEVEANPPVVEGRPAFRLSARNNDGVFPPPPGAGEEFRFAAANNIDAFLVGSVSEFHGRVHLQVSVYTLHTRSFSSHYSVLFSSAELISSVDEIANRLVTAVSGIQPAGILVHTSVPYATILVDGVFLGRGDMEMRTHFPGEVTLEVHAYNHSSAVFPITLYPGEISEVFIDLTPLSLSAFEVVVEDSPGSLVYSGGLFIGQTPLTVEVPRGRFAYITVETPDGEIGTMVYRDGALVRGNARFVIGHADPAVGATAFMTPQMPIPPEAQRVERARRGFYWAYGVTWIVLPASLLVAGIANTRIDANNNMVMGAMPPSLGAPTPEQMQRTFDRAVRANNIRTAAFAVMGVSLGVTFFQIFRYIRAASGDATPLIRVVPPVENDYEAPAYEYNGYNWGNDESFF